MSSPSKADDSEAERSNRVFVGCLSKFTKDESLYTLFGGLPGFVSSQVVVDKESGLCKGYGFLVFTTCELAEECIKLMDGVELDGRFINVKWCISKAFPPDANPVPRRFDRHTAQPREHMVAAREGRNRQVDPEQTYAVRISGLPSDALWMELKDFLRSIGDIQFVGINRDGTAIARFCNYEDKLNAINTLNGSKYLGSRIAVVALDEDRQRPAAKRPYMDGYERPPMRRPPGPYATYGREGAYPTERDSYEMRPRLRGGAPMRGPSGRLPVQPHMAYPQDGYPYEYEVYEYEDEGYYDPECLYEGEAEMYEEYAAPVFRGDDGRSRRAPMRSVPAAYVRYAQ